MPDGSFRADFEQHRASLSRLAYLMTGESDVPDYLAAEALT